MVDQNVLAEKVNYIEDNLQKLSVLRELSQSEFLDKFYYVGSAKYYLQTCIEAIIDIAHHIIARERYRSPENYADAFKVLGENGLFSEHYTAKFCRMARFRNRIVHLYYDVDDKELYRILRDDLEDIDYFVKAIVKRYLLN